MKKVNEFIEKYISAVWCLVAALWFFVDYFTIDPKSTTILYSGIFWVAFSVIEFFRVKSKNKNK